MIFLSNLLFGIVFGSFLNVVIYRLKNDLPATGRSFCPWCKTRLKWHDLMPVFSFIYLYGRCRYCQKKISWQYPAVEILSGFIWVAVFYKVFGNLGFEVWSLFRLSAEASAQAGISDFGFRILLYFYYVFIFSALLIVAVYDFKWKIIPDKIVYPAITIAFIYNALNAFISGNYKIFIMPVVAASIAFLFFFPIYFFSKGKAMGLGDGKLAFLIGLFLNPLLSVIAFVSAFVIGAVFGIILLGFGGKTLKSQIAFGPFLAIGAAIAFFLSNFINNFFIF